MNTALSTICARLPLVRLTSWLVWFVAHGVLIGNFLLAQTPATVAFKNGTTISVKLLDADFALANRSGTEGELTRIPWSQIKTVVFAARPGDSELEEVLRAIAALNSPDYHLREQAENWLLQLPYLGNYRPQLQAETNNPSLELRYRAARILKQFDRSRSSSTRGRSPVMSPAAESDVVILKSGRPRLSKPRNEGTLKFSWRDERHEVPLNELDRIVVAQPALVPENAGTAFRNRVRITQDLEGADAWEGIPELLFAQDYGAHPLEPFMIVDDTFAQTGIRFFSEGDNQIILADVSNVSATGPTLKSLCVFDTPRSRRTFSGKIRVSFCVPGLPDVPATVQAVGLSLAIIDNPKDMVMEAYDVDGRIIATVEAGGNRTQFFGLESEIPIAYVEIKLNEHLQTLEREIDKTYSLQSFRNSPPQPAISYLNRRPEYAVRLRTGEVFFVPELDWQGTELRVTSGQLPTFAVPFAELAAIQGPDVNWREPSPDTLTCFAKLASGSVLQVNPLAGYSAIRQPDWQFPSSEQVALWWPQDELRYPRDEDFDEPNKAALVFPTCRKLLPRLEISDREILWSSESATVRYPELLPTIKPIYADENEKVVPRFTSLLLANSRETQVPSVWFRPHEQLATPYLLLRNGERFDLTEMFQLQKIDATSLTLVGPGERTLTIKWSEVAMLKLW
ncbi:MAG: hypothetical protein KF851_12345 [Pirellulaceae bacterium]|nr:hypothetical protein [Pirellulaceae bacterium]